MLKNERRYLQLMAFQKAKDIKSLERNKKFIIINEFTDNMGILEEEVYFIADFFYFDKIKNVFVVEVAKISFDKKNLSYKMQRKLMKKLYPKYHFIET